jgi:hypothetical protein
MLAALRFDFIAPIFLNHGWDRSMTRLTAFVLGLGVLASSSALAAERTVTLAVQNMFCADCPFIVKKNLEAAGCR